MTGNLKEKNYKDLGTIMNTEQRELKKLAKALYQRGHVAQAEGIRDLALIKEAYTPDDEEAARAGLMKLWHRMIASGRAAFDKWRGNKAPGQESANDKNVYEGSDDEGYQFISQALTANYRSYIEDGDGDGEWAEQPDDQKLTSLKKALSGFSDKKEQKVSTQTEDSKSWTEDNFDFGTGLRDKDKTKKWTVYNPSRQVRNNRLRYGWQQSAPVMWFFVMKAGAPYKNWLKAHRAAEKHFVTKIKEDEDTATTTAKTEKEVGKSRERKKLRTELLATQWPGMPGQDGAGKSVHNAKWGKKERVGKKMLNVAWYQHYAYLDPTDTNSAFGIMVSKLIIRDKQHWNEELGGNLPRDLAKWTRQESTFKKDEGPKKASQRYDLTKHANPFGGGAPVGSSGGGPDFGGGGGSGGGSKRKMKDLSKGVIYNSTTGNEFRQWVINNKNEEIKAIAPQNNLDPTGSWYNKYIRDALNAVKAKGFDYKSGGKTVDPADAAEGAAQANIKADKDTLKAYLLHDDSLEHRDHMLSGVPNTSKHGGPFKAYTNDLLLDMNPKDQAKKVDAFLRSSTAWDMLLSAYRADVVGNPSLELAMTTAAHERAEAAKEAEKAKEEKTKREKEAVKSNDYYIIPPTGEESLVKDSDNNFKKGTIFVSKQNGDTYYVGQAQGRPKQLFSLQLRAMGRGGVRGTNVLSEEELTKLRKVVPDSHWEVWEEFFGDREQYLESLTESQNDWNPATWFRESRETEKVHYDNATKKLRQLHESTRPSGNSLAANMNQGGGRQPMGGRNPFPTPGDGQPE